MFLAAACCQALADRFGRKRLLLVATLIFGAFTLLTAHADTYAQLMACRLLAGIECDIRPDGELDLTDEDAPARVAEAVEREHGALHLLVNNAGARWGGSSVWRTRLSNTNLNKNNEKAILNKSG